jgi:tetratricopeptide (TPR) repeat protein
MEFLYNPNQMPEEEIKATFVARHALIDEIISTIEHQPDGAGVQHLVIIAPRGMGKTTMMLMVKFAIKERGIADTWQVVKFAEESPGIYDLADFWLEVLKLLAADTKDKQMEQRISALEAKYRNNDDLQEAALALIKDWRREHQKRLLLLVENFDMILEQINDERDNARLRDALMNNGTLMLVGGATSFFKEARAYDQPLYNFFKIYNLHDLRFEQMKELLLKRAKVDKMPNFEKVVQANIAGLRALEYFTGGNPRLVLMLYRVVKNSALKEIRRELEKLLDEVTPLFKHKIESLPPQQRKILDHIARISGETREGVTPGEIAEAVRLAPNQVSSQLKRLMEMGYVRAANLRRRASYYTLSEPLYAIWYQMRFGRQSRERMQWLITFLKVFFTREEMLKQSGDLDLLFRKRLKDGRHEDARDTLELHDYLSEAMEDASMRASAKERVIRGYQAINDIETIKRDLLPTVKLEDLSEELRVELLQAGCISAEQAESARLKGEIERSIKLEKEYTEEMAAAALAFDSGEFDDALKHLDRALEINPDDDEGWYNRGIALDDLGRYEEAIASYDRAIEIKPDDDGAWNNRGNALDELGRFDEAIASYDRAIEINPNDDQIWNNRGSALIRLKRYNEAIASYDRAIEIKPDKDQAWYNRGIALKELRRLDEAIASYDRAIEINTDRDQAWYNRGNILVRLKRYNEAIASYDRAIEIKPDLDQAWNNRGNALDELGRFDEAIASYDRAIEIKPDKHEAWYNLGNTFARLKNYDKAIASYDRAIEIKPDKDQAWYNRGTVYLEKFTHSTQSENYRSARSDWQKGLESFKNDSQQRWQAKVSSALLSLAQEGEFKFVRELIAESHLEEELFPLARAIDYLQADDENLKEELIERLSPEVKGIVEEVIAKLQPVVQKSSRQKAKTPVKAKRRKK